MKKKNPEQFICKTPASKGVTSQNPNSSPFEPDPPPPHQGSLYGFELGPILLSLTKFELFLWKIISLSWKLTNYQEKAFTHFHIIVWAKFPKCLASFVTYDLRGNTAPHALTLKQSLMKLSNWNCQIQWASTRDPNLMPSQWSLAWLTNIHRKVILGYV